MRIQGRIHTQLYFFIKMLSSVAVLLPVYFKDNPSKFEQSLLSIINQSYPSDLIHIYLGVDGCVGDDIETLIKRYSRYLFKIHRSEECRGLASTLNSLLSLIEYEKFAARHDADDICFPHRIEQQVNFFESNPTTGVLGGAIYEVSSKSSQILGLRTFPQSSVDCYSCLPFGAPFAHPSVMFNLNVVRKFLEYPEITGNEDIALWFYLAKLGIIFANLLEPIIYFSVDDDFYARRSKNKALTELKVYIFGVFNLYGLTFKLIIPFVRFVFRFLPLFILKMLYKSYNLRNFLIKGHV